MKEIKVRVTLQEDMLGTAPNNQEVYRDYIASKALANGRDCDSKLRLTFPDGAVFTAPVVLQVKDFMGGDATNVAPLTFDCVSNGKPTFEPKKA